MDKSEILKKAIKKSAEYVSSIKEPARRAVVKTSYQEGFIDGVCFTQTWISPLIEKQGGGYLVLGNGQMDKGK